MQMVVTKLRCKKSAAAIVLTVAAAALLVTPIAAQPPGGPPVGGGGSTTTSSAGYVTSGAAVTACQAASPTSCTSASSLYVSRSLTYSPTTGVFTGNLTANGCPSTWSSPVAPMSNSASSSCFTQTFPAYSTTSATAAPLTGFVALSLNGMDIFNALEAGFSSSSGPTICSNTGYYCAGGADLTSCNDELTYTCGTSGASSLATTLAGNILGDSCNGHATPYHFHKDLKCEYSPAATATASTVTAHSPLIGIALDGYGIYGAWEGTGGSLPTLDACNGHVGVVPGTASVGSTATVNATAGITGLASSSVYHYHTSTTFPYTVGCYGGGAAVSTATCRALYSTTCNTWVPFYAANGSTFFFDDWCPCGNGGAQPKTAYNTLPSVSGATCYSSFSGNQRAPSSTSGTTTCSLSLLGATSSTPTTTVTSTPASASATTAPVMLVASAVAMALAL